MKINPKLALAFGLLVTAGATLVAAQGNITLKVLTMTAPDSIKEINAAFEKENPGIKLNFEIIPDPQYGTAIEARLAGGDAPDVLGGHARQEMPKWQKAGYIEDLTTEGANISKLQVMRCQPKMLTIEEDLGGGSDRGVKPTILGQGF